MKMTPEETLYIERACERLVLDAVYLTDRQDYAAYVALTDAAGVADPRAASALRVA